MNSIRRPGWFPALIVAVLLHAAIAVAVLLQAPTRGTALPGVSGMQVGLAAAGGAAGEVTEVEGAPSEAGTLAPETAETVTAEAVAEAVPASETVPVAIDAPAAPAPVESPAVAEVQPPSLHPTTPVDPQPVTPVHETVEAVAPTSRTAAEALQAEQAPDIPVPLEHVELVTEQVATIVAAQPADPVPAPEAPAKVTTARPVEAVELPEPTPPPPPAPVTETTAAVSPPPLPVPRPRKPARQSVEAPRPQPAVEPEAVNAVNTTTPAPEVSDPPPTETGPAIDGASTTGPGDAVQQAALVTGGGGRSGDRAGEGVSSQEGTRSGGGNPGEREDYMTRLLNWLERHKKYPRRAQRRRQEGTAMLFFRMDREGQVTEFRIEQGSGHALLDAEVKAMIRRAQPLPAMPDFMQQSQLELLVPVNFALR